MPGLELRELTPSDLPEAGRLLAQRHRRHRLSEPLLPAAYEDPAAAAAEVAAALASDGALGSVALRDGALVGYMVGAPKPAAGWGPNIWVESAGFAVDHAEDVRDLYAAAARRWMGDGATAHYALVPAQDADVVDAWFRLAFGHQHTHAIQEARAVAVTIDPGVAIRRARRTDIPVLAQLDLALPDHQASSPVFSSGPTSTIAEAQEEWEEDFDDDAFSVFVAESGGAVVGSAIGCSVEKSSLHSGLARPSSAGFLGFAAVLPEARGLGVGRALGETVVAWSAESGYEGVVTDWRATNLLSSRTWPRLGFRTTFVRLHRNVGY